jgi:Uma2 family endonuclease
MTWEAFERLPDGDGLHREILEGDLQILPPVKLAHSIIAKRIYNTLVGLELMADGQAYIEAGFKLSSNPPTWVQPDVSFIRNDRALTTDDGQYLLQAPELAIEIVSPSETATMLQRKVELMLASGAQAVWVIYPDSKTVSVHLPNGTAATHSIGDTLTASFLAGDWTLPVASIFENV